MIFPAVSSRGTQCSDIRVVLVKFLADLDTLFPAVSGSYDVKFAESVCEEALWLGFHPNDINDSEFQRALKPSVAITLAMYPHQKMDTQYWICIFTTCLVYLDDLAMQGRLAVEGPGFGIVTIAPVEREAQGHPMVNNLARTLHATEKHFGQLSANLIASDTFRFMSAVILENQTRDFQAQVHEDAINYPGFFRSMTGLGISYTIFAFPLHIPLQEYILVLPEMARYIENTNDLFSFYKEEIDGEENNHISLLSRTESCGKMEAMRRLAKLTIDGCQRVRNVLAPEVYSIAYEHVFLGFIAYHAMSPRYRLDDLHLQGEEHDYQ